MLPMAASPTTALQSWRFTYPLVYVLVDGKQIANGEVFLVIKCEVTQSPAFSARHVNAPRGIRHKLMVFLAKETKPRVDLLLDGFLSATPEDDAKVSMRYSVRSCRFIINGSSDSTPRHLYDLRFRTSDDLKNAVARLTDIGLICRADDEAPAPKPSQSKSPGILSGSPSNSCRSQTLTPTIVLSQEQVKAGRVVSPLQRRPDGSTPRFYLRRVPKNGSQSSTTATLPTQTSFSPGLALHRQLSRSPKYKDDTRSHSPHTLPQAPFSPHLSPDGYLMPPPRRDTGLTSPDGSPITAGVGEPGEEEVLAKGPKRPRSSHTRRAVLPVIRREPDIAPASPSRQPTCSPSGPRQPLEELPQASVEPQLIPCHTISGGQRGLGGAVTATESSHPQKRSTPLDTTLDPLLVHPVKRIGFRRLPLEVSSNRDHVASGVENGLPGNRKPPGRHRKAEKVTASLPSGPPSSQRPPADRSADHTSLDGLGGLHRKTPQPPMYQDALVQTSNYDEIEAAIADRIRKGHLRQFAIWKDLEEVFLSRVDAAEDNPEALLQVVDDYQKSLAAGLGRGLDLYIK